MKSNKVNQVKFRLDNKTNIALKTIIKSKKVKLQFVMEELVSQYIVKNVDSLVNEEK